MRIRIGRRLFGKSLREVIKDSGGFLLVCLFWVTLYPLTLLVPRKKGLWLFIGREEGKFVDNVKHMYAHVAGISGITAIFVSEDLSLCRKLRELGASAVEYPGLRGVWLLLRAEILLVDSMNWPDHGRGQLAHGARLLQMWHGIPLKEIELPMHARRLARIPVWRRIVLNIYKRVTLRYPVVDWLVSTSAFMTAHAFDPCFNFVRVIETGYPRNDILLGKPRGALAERLINLNVDARARGRIESFRTVGGKCLLYAPTFRKHMQSPFENGTLELEAMQSFLVRHNILLALKLHPLMSGRQDLQSMGNLVWIEPDSDIYPLLPLFDALITDYSSIYFDFLLLDREIIFFPYDLDSYVAEDRKLFFDYNSVTPGAKCFDQSALQQAVTDNLRGEGSSFADGRAALRQLAFSEYRGNAAMDIFAAIASQGPSAMDSASSTGKPK